MIKSRKHSHLFSSRRVQKGELEGGESRGMTDRRGMSLLAFDPSACGVPGRCLLGRPIHGGYANHFFKVYMQKQCAGVPLHPNGRAAADYRVPPRTTAYHRGRGEQQWRLTNVEWGGGDAAAADRRGPGRRAAAAAVA